MRKILAIIVVITVACAVLWGCTPGENIETPYEVLQREYKELTEATSIEQTIEIKTGEMVQYTRKRVFDKTETGYDVEETESKLNELTSETEEAYTSTTRQFKVNSAEEISLPINLDDESIYDDFTLDETHLICKVKDDKIKEATSLTDEDIPAPITGMTIEIEFGTHVTGLTVEYLSGESLVKITYSAAY